MGKIKTDLYVPGSVPPVPLIDNVNAIKMMYWANSIDYTTALLSRFNNDQEFCLLAFQEKFFENHDVPDRFKSEQYWRIAVSRRHYSLGIVPHHWRTEEVCKLAVGTSCHCCNNIEDVPNELLSEEMYKLSVRRRGTVGLLYIPRGKKTEELCRIALDAHQYSPNASKEDRMKLCSLQYIPPKLRSPEICLLGVQIESLNLDYVPYKLKTTEMCQIAVANNCSAIRYVPTSLMTEAMCILVVQEDGELISYIPEDYLTPKIWKAAVLQRSRILEHVEKKFLTEELCNAAIMKNNQEGLRYVPESFKSKELCQMAVKMSPRNLVYVPDDLITADLCRLAVINFHPERG